MNKAIKLLQGYIWHPIGDAIALDDYLEEHLDDDIHLLWDKVPAPFTFFDDGTLASSQQLYQFTVIKIVDEQDDASGLIPWLAERVQAMLESTPPGVGWQIFEDLREV